MIAGHTGAAAAAVVPYDASRWGKDDSINVLDSNESVKVGDGVAPSCENINVLDSNESVKFGDGVAPSCETAGAIGYRKLFPLFLSFNLKVLSHLALAAPLSALVTFVIWPGSVKALRKEANATYYFVDEYAACNDGGFDLLVLDSWKQIFSELASYLLVRLTLPRLAVKSAQVYVFFGFLVRLFLMINFDKVKGRGLQGVCLLLSCAILLPDFLALNWLWIQLFRYRKVLDDGFVNIKYYPISLVAMMARGGQLLIMQCWMVLLVWRGIWRKGDLLEDALVTGAGVVIFQGMSSHFMYIMLSHLARTLVKLEEQLFKFERNDGLKSFKTIVRSVSRLEAKCHVDFIGWVFFAFKNAVKFPNFVVLLSYDIETFLMAAPAGVIFEICGILPAIWHYKRCTERRKTIGMIDQSSNLKNEEKVLEIRQQLLLQKLAHEEAAEKLALYGAIAVYLTTKPEISLAQQLMRVCILVFLDQLGYVLKMILTFQRYRLPLRPFLNHASKASRLLVVVIVVANVLHMTFTFSLVGCYF